MDNSEMSYSFPMPAFRENHLVLKEEIKNLKRNSNILQCRSFQKICMDVEKKILDFDEEPTLSILQNKVRKLDTGSELCKEICLLQRHFSNLEINRAVSEVLDEEKYEKLSRKIMLRKQLELKTEKFFKTQAASITKLCSEHIEDQRGELGVIKSPIQTVTVPDEALQNPNSELEDQITLAQLPKYSPDTGRIDGRENGNLVDENLRVSNMPGTRVTDLPPSLGDITVPEIDARKMDQESELNVDLNELECILEQRAADLEEIPIINEKTDIPELTNGEAAQSIDLENLPPLSDTRAKKKKRSLPVFDPSTSIRNYSKRARRLNASINVERVQVYEGPPSILHAFTIGHVLETPAVNNGYSGAVRSSVLQRLYSRHQKTEQTSGKMLCDDFQPRRSFASEMSNVEEVIGPRQEARSDVRKSLLLDISVVPTDKTEIRDSAMAEGSAAELKGANLIDAPVSKTIEEEIVPPLDRATDPCLPQISRTINLEDKSLEEPTADTSFKPTGLSAPREKWREFKYVRKRLEEVWMAKEEKKLEKSASLREVLEKENEWGKANMLTLLRIVDKMSLRRQVVIKGRGANVIIQPFEMPFVTEKQYSLHEQAPRF